MSRKVMPWDEAILTVLKGKQTAMHYRDIASEIVEQQLRPEENIGSTPATTVNAYIRGDKLKDKVIPTGKKGEYILKDLLDKDSTMLSLASAEQSDDDDDNEMGDALITAFGRFWDRNLFSTNKNCLYRSNLRFPQAKDVDFSDHPGVYLLHMGHAVVYVGQATHLAERIAYHLKDDKRNRWNSFSWFSIKPLDDGEGSENECKGRNLLDDYLLDTLEALLIETLGPERNKRSGNEFDDKEFEQVEASEYYRALSQAQKNKKKKK